MKLNKERIISRDGDVFYLPSFFSKEQADYYFSELHEKVDWKQEPILLFGKEIMQPRLTSWFGDEGKNYSYSGITMYPHVWMEPLTTLRRKVEELSGEKFNSALLNLYRDHRDSVGWHRDNEKELGDNPSIISISLGATREFKLKHRRDKSLKASVNLSHGDLLIMTGETQVNWLHSVPKKVKPKGLRINITFRNIIN